MREALSRQIELLKALPPPRDEDGETLALEVLPPATAEQIERFAAVCGGRLPDELAAFLSITAGFRGAVDFEPEPTFLEQDFVGTLRAYDYGNGDGLGLEPAGERCRVWWIGHDPYFLIFHAESITALLGDWRARLEGLGDGWLNPGDLFFQPAAESPACHKGQVDAGADTTLASFLDALPADALVHDLRAAVPGTEIPFERLGGLVTGGEVRRHGLVFAFLPAPPPAFVAPHPPAHYLAQEPDPHERQILASLPKGALVLHARDCPRGARMDTSDAYPDQDISWKPPFHVLYPRPKPWWRFW